LRSLSFAFVLAAMVATTAIVGCGDSKVDDKQPKLVNPPDPKITGPAKIGGDGDNKAKDATIP
jgi:hypothetical protein